MKSNFNPANLITIFRLLLIIPIIYFLLNDQTTNAIWIYLLVLILDFLDGFIARKLNCETAFGKNFDFITDGLVGGTIILILLIQNKIPLLYLYLLIPPFLMILIAVLWGMKKSKNAFIPSKWRKLNGVMFFLTIVLLMLNNSMALTLAYVILGYFYLSRIKHFIELSKLK